MFPLGGMPGYNPMMPFPLAMQQASQYNPHERMDMRPMASTMGMGIGRLPHQRAPLLPRDAETNGTFVRKPGELPVIQDLTPRIPQEDPAAGSSSIPMVTDAPPIHPDVAAIPIQMQQDVDMSLPSNPMAAQRNGSRPPRGGPRGIFGDAASFRPERRNDKTLVIEKIPEDKLSLGAINDWFKKFGTVTNVAVDTSTCKALVSFADHTEAHAAWKSQDAVFGNRFVKVFWHRPMEGHGQKGSRLLAASADLVAKVSTKETTPSSSTAPTSDASHPAPPTPIRKPALSSSAASLAAKQKLLEQQIAEQKSLMTLLSSATGDEKKQIMARLRKLNEEMKPAPPITSAEAESSTTTPGKTSRGTTPRTDAHEVKEKERLDRELDMRGATAGGDAEEDTDELKARLAKLKAEVC
jgi:RNA-binding protein 26